MSRLRPKRTAKAAKRFSENINDRHLGLRIQVESMFSASCMKEVSEIQHLFNQPRRNWKLKADVVNEREVFVDGIIVAPFPPNVLADNGKIYNSTARFDQISIQFFIEEELKGDS